MVESRILGWLTEIKFLYKKGTHATKKPRLVRIHPSIAKPTRIESLLQTRQRLDKMVKFAVLLIAATSAFCGIATASNCKHGLYYCGHGLLHKGKF